MILNGHFALRFKIHAFSEHTTKIWMKIDPQYTVYADIRGGSMETRRQTTTGYRVIENVDFQGFRMLRLRTLGNEANIITVYSII